MPLPRNGPIDEDVFLHGYCHLFAFCLNRMTGYPIRMVVDDDPEIEDGERDPKAVYLVHAFNVRPDGTLVDASGTVDEAAAVGDYGEPVAPRVVDVSPERFRSLFRWFGRVSASDVAATEAFVQERMTFYATDSGRRADDGHATDRTSVSEDDVEAHVTNFLAGWRA